MWWRSTNTWTDRTNTAALTRRALMGHAQVEPIAADAHLAPENVRRRRGPGQAEHLMSEHVVFRVADREPAGRDEPLGDHGRFADPIGVNSGQRSKNASGAIAVSCNATVTSGRGWCDRRQYVAVSCAAGRRDEHRHLRSVVVRDDLMELNRAAAR